MTSKTEEEPDSATASVDPRTDSASIATPHQHDVLCGRGNHTKKHPGNQHFLALVEMHKAVYVTSPKGVKSAYARRIVDAIQSLDPPGRFIEKDSDTQLWREVDDERAMEKARRALRDGAPELITALGDVDREYPS